MADAKNTDRLERLIMGLEMSIPDMKSRLGYCSDEVEKRYTAKFIASMEEQLEKARTELEGQRKA
jgi:hypothetical protein